MTVSLFSGTIFNIETRKDLKSLEKHSEVKKTTANGAGEGLFCLWMLLFAVFEIVILVVLMARTFQKLHVPDQPDQSEETTTEDTEEVTDEPSPSVPVFAGGKIPTLPSANASTQAISVINSSYALLVNRKTGEIVAQKDADRVFQPASLTKVMTLIVACENLTEEDLERKLALTQEVTNYVTSGSYKDSSVSLIDQDKYLNDEFLIRDLLYGIGVESAADCTYMIAKEISGSEEAFVKLMNQKASELGLTDTHFDNAIGHESENNYTTAREMTVIMMYALQCDLIEDILSVESHGYRGYYLDNGVLKTYPRTFYSTLFRSRMETYERHAGKPFSLEVVTLKAGKTGSFITSSYMVCSAKAVGASDEYILVLGDAPKNGSIPASYGTMCDIKTVFDTYIK